MNSRIVRLSLGGLVLMLVSLACGIGSLTGPTASPTPAPLNPPTSTPLPPSPLPPSATPAPVLVPSDTPIPDQDTIMKNNGFERNAALDSACGTACTAYKNASINAIADFYYTNKSFSILYYGTDKNGSAEQAEAVVINQVLADLYPGNLCSDILQIASDFPNHIGTSRGISGNFIWTVSINATYNLDKTIKQATIYIAVTPG
jgi:hypothetical protein